MKDSILLLLIFMVSCNFPLGSGDITVSFKEGPTPPGTPSGGSGGGPLFQPFTHQVPFTSGTEANYVLSDPTNLEIIGDQVRLKPRLFSDQNATAAGFGGGLLYGVTWDSTNNFLRLNSTTNIFNHGIDWSPKVGNVIAYYKLDEAGYTGAANELRDSGPNSFHGQSLSTFSNAPGKINNAGVFDGTRVVGMPDIDAFEDLSNFSIAVWVKPTNLTGSGQGVVGKRVYYDNEQSFDFFFYSGNVLTVDIAGADNRFNSNFIFENNKWYHIVLTFDGSQPPNNRVRLYVNGNLDQIATENSSTIPNYTAPILIGSMDLSGSYNFHGQIDEVVFWNETLNSAEIKYMHAKQSPRISGGFVSRVFDSNDTGAVWPFLSPITSLPHNKELPATNGSELTSSYSGIVPNLMNGLIAYWKLNETAGSPLIADSSGNNQMGTATPIEFGDQRGLFSHAAFFNGGKISINDTFMNNIPEFSISAWIAPAYLTNGAGGPDVSIIGKNGVVQIGMELGYICASAVVDSSFICGPTTANTGEWTHVMVTGDASTFSLYINGQFVNSAGHSGAHYGSSSYDFNMGAEVWDNVGHHYIGLLDEVAVWNRALTVAEIKNLYRRGGQQLLYQVRSCSNSDCSDQDAAYGLGWIGPGGDSVFHFSENHNYTTLLPNLTGNGNTKIESLTLPFSLFPDVTITPRRYFQYKVIFTSNDVNDLCDYGGGPEMCSPELQSVTIGPSYSTTAQTITTTLPLTSPFETLNLNGFIETLGSNGCNGEARYSLSTDGTNFYFFDGSSWTLSNTPWTEANDAINLALTINTFPTAIGTGNLFIRAHLRSNGSEACEIDNIQISGTKP